VSLARKDELRPVPHRLILELPRWEARPMPLDEPVPGPIDGLRLSRRAWKVLQQENIITLGQLRAVADRLERFDRIGSKTAQTIRAELARINFQERPRHYRGHWARP
jgi:DNA-directed RNA polymerase alpha subunit